MLMRFALSYGARIVLSTITVLATSAVARADEPAASEGSPREKRLAFLRSQVDKFEIKSEHGEQRLLHRGQQPVLRWSNPVRDFVNDGVTYLFLEGQRPRAIVTVWVRSRESSLESGELWREHITLSREPLTCRRDGAVIWSPKTAEVVDEPLTDAAPPAQRPSQRLVQMRELARRFHAATYKTESANELRLLSQPLYRYPSENTDVLDGALFGFAEANDPEALLLLEAVAIDSGNQSEWRYTLARSTSFRVVVRLDDREVFAVEPYWKVPRKTEAAYLEARDGEFALDGISSDSSDSE